MAREVSDELIWAFEVAQDAAEQTEQLTIIMCSLERASMELEWKHPAYRWLVEAAKATHRLSVVTAGLLSYSHPVMLDQRHQVMLDQRHRVSPRGK